MDFITGLYSEAHVAAAGEPDAVRVPAVDLFTARGDLLKLDIEGGEWAILTDPRLAELEVDAIVLEWHHRHAPAADPGDAATSLLRDAGYTEIRQEAEYHSTGTLWAWRPR